MQSKVTSASVTAERISPSADLLSAWLADRLKVKVQRRSSQGPGITRAVLTTKKGDIVISRGDGKLATLSAPGEPDRPVALKVELRLLDPDDVYARTVKRMVKEADK